MGKVKLLIIGIFFMTSAYGRSYESRRDSTVFIHLSSIKHYLDSLGVEEIDYVLAQAILETKWFRCKSCTWNNNNMFGFRNKNGKYMKFDTWQQCVVYYAIWQKKRYSKYKIKYPTGDYLKFLLYCRYAESKEYTKNVKQIYNWLKINYIE